jgi:hypothetical protein
LAINQSVHAEADGGDDFAAEALFKFSQDLEFIAAHSTPVALCEEILKVRVLQPALHYKLEQISKKLPTILG